MALPVSFFQNDPNTAAENALIQQRMAMSQALLQQGTTPIDTNNRSIGGVGYRVSPMEGLAKLLQAYTGRQGVEQATRDQGALANQAHQALVNSLQTSQTPSFDPSQVSDASSNALASGAAQGSVGPTDANAQSMGQALMQTPPANAGRPTNPLNPNNVPPEMLARIIQGMVPDEVGKSILARYAPTSTTVQALQGNQDPVSANANALAKSNAPTPEYYALQSAGVSPDMIKTLMLGKAAKEAEIERKSGNQFVNPVLNSSGIVPKIPDNANPVGGIAPNGALTGGVSQMPGARQISAGNAGANAGAVAAAQAPFDALTGYDPVTNTPYFTSKSAALGIGGSSVPASQGAPSSNAPQPGGMASQPAQGPAPQLMQPHRTQAGAGPLVGGRIEGVQSHFKYISEQADQAESVNANLGNIMGLAQRAQSGPLSDRLTYVNSLLSLVGSEKATDQNTAIQLLNKNSNQIVTRLGGSGSLGTDAARQILMSAYPNSHMNPDALNEASRNLMGANEMVKAERKFLQPSYQSSDIPGYEQKRAFFTSNANANLFQWHNMPDGAAKTAFGKKLVQQDPHAIDKLDSLEQAGVFK